MNRYPLNSRVIGAGSESPLSYVAAIQNFVLQVAATAVAIRGMRANQSLTLNQTARAIITRLFAAAQELALNVTLTTKTYYMTYAEAAQDLVLATTATARQRIKRYAQASQAFALTASFTIHQWIKTYASALQNFAMTSSAKNSRRTFAATLQSLTVVGVLRTRVTRGMKATGLLALNGAVEIRTALKAAMTQVLALTGIVIASDRTSSPANVERTAVVPRDTRTTVVPGESYESGV